MVSEGANPQQTVLLVEGEDLLQNALSDLLTKGGYNLLVVRNGIEALKKAREFDGVIHLLLSDLETAGMTGVELATQLSLERPSIRILLISGLPSGVLVLNNGWHFLPKPFMWDMLRDRIHDFLLEPPVQGFDWNA